MRDALINLLCSSWLGFLLVYKLGFARYGVDFIDVGQEDQEGADQDEG